MYACTYIFNHLFQTLVFELCSRNKIENNHRQYNSKRIRFDKQRREMMN